MKPTLKATERVLLFTGLLLIGHWVHAQASSWLFQRQHLQSWVSPADSAKESEVPSAPALGEVMGRIDIPDVGVQAVILEGTEEDQLKLAVGHLPGTALPGQPGNAVLAGHRDAHFRGLRDIRIDQSIVITTADGTHEYLVDEMKIVEPDDVSVFEHSGNHSRLTLITCFPFSYIGKAPQRFIIHARSVPLDTLAARRTPS